MVRLDWVWAEFGLERKLKQSHLRGVTVGHGQRVVGQGLGRMFLGIGRSCSDRMLLSYGQVWFGQNVGGLWSCWV